MEQWKNHDRYADVLRMHKCWKKRGQTKVLQELTCYQYYNNNVAKTGADVSGDQRQHSKATFVQCCTPVRASFCCLCLVLSKDVTLPSLQTWAER